MPDADQSQRRPQALMLALLGEYVLDRRVCVSSGSVIDVLGRAGVSEHAARSTLTRMVGRDLLRRRPRGRRMYFGLTDRSIKILEEGAERIWQAGAVNRDWDGTWTLLGFSLPGSWQRERHDLRSQLGWAGFGPLQGGLWIAPGTPDVRAIVADLGLTAQVRVFRARADEVTDVDRLVRETWDLAGLAARYEEFLKRWDGLPQADPLAAKLGLVSDWLQIIRRDPRLPVRHLPPDWPAVRAQDLFHRLARRLNPGARAVAGKVLDTIPDD